MEPAATSSAITPPPACGRVFFISAVVFAGCVAFFLCELEGFRVFDQSMWGIHSKESGITSPQEMLVFFGGIALGIIAGIVALVSTFVWIYLRLHHASKGSNRNA